MRHLFAALVFALSPLPALANAQALGLALDALAQGDATLAAEAAGRIDDPVALDVVRWTELRAGDGEFGEYQEFLAGNPDWPGLDLLRRRGEGNIPESARAPEVIAYFADTAPQTGTGALRLAAARAATGDSTGADAMIVNAWTTMVMTQEEARTMLARDDALLADHHIARLDNLLWEGVEDRARAMFTLVPAGWVQLAEARIALRHNRPGVDDLIAAVPAALADDAGLAFERFMWRMRAGAWDAAGDLMAERSDSAERLGHPEKWADRRADLVRDVMREGQFDLAYEYAANHHVREEDSYQDLAELAWLAGYTALRRGEPMLAIGHFERFRDTVFSPISVGRAGYWLGRAHEAAGNAPTAAAAYALGAQYQSSFYGQLAAERGGLPTDLAFLAQEDFGDWRMAGFAGATVFHAGLILYEAGQIDLAERFLTHLTESLNRTDAGRLGDMALDLGDPHLALMIAKRAAQSGFEIMRAYYPLANLTDAALPIPPALALSIARRESEFDPGVVSGAGAIGLMQVMPGTGRDTAAVLNLPYSETRLRTDADYNVLLGTTFLAGLIERFDGNPVLIAIAYNAGPRRADEWIARFGDPRAAGVDIVDWIEALPFTETRNYVMRVTESLPIYEAQLTGQLPASDLGARLRR